MKSKENLLADPPTEDYFGSEIRTGDTIFEDAAGRIVLMENADQYLQDIGGVEIYREIK